MTHHPLHNDLADIGILGLGAIGSHLAEHVVRTQGVGQVFLCDPARYEAKNLRSQAIAPEDVGQPKAVALARRLRRLTPHLIRPFWRRVEDVPLGRLRCNALLAALDSRAARQSVNRIAWRLGIPWIDAGIEPGRLLARVNVYVPGPDTPCLECAWSEADYAALEQVHPCAAPARAATNAPAALGALAASLAALELHKLLAGQLDDVARGRQVLLDARHHQHFVTTYRRNPACRFDHQTWRIASLPPATGQVYLEEVLRRGGSGSALRVEGMTFARRLLCTGCGAPSAQLHLTERLSPSRHACGRCGARLAAAGFDRCEWLEHRALTAEERCRSLRQLGLRRGDVLTVRGSTGESHWEWGKDRGSGLRS